jgi:hypothetical protein
MRVYPVYTVYITYSSIYESLVVYTVYITYITYIAYTSLPVSLSLVGFGTAARSPSVCNMYHNSRHNYTD